LFGDDLARLPEGDLSARRRRVGVVFGGGGRLFQHLTVAENVALPLAYHVATLGEADLGERVGSVLSALGLEAWEGRKPSELSRRQAQRVALARALILAPEVLLLDDPWSGLPRSEPDWWREQFERIQANGSVRTWVVVAADAGPWEGWADRFAHMEVRRWQVVDREDGREPLEPGVASSNS
jgi:ABC-type sulfate/molybdate transport systems ATPase subunit